MADPPNQPRRRPAKPLSTYRALGLGLELGTVIGGLAVAGYFADRYFGTEPWLTYLGVFLGVVGGVYNVVREVLRTSGSGDGARSRSKRREER